MSNIVDKAAVATTKVWGYIAMASVVACAALVYVAINESKKAKRAVSSATDANSKATEAEAKASFLGWPRRSRSDKRKAFSNSGASLAPVNSCECDDGRGGVIFWGCQPGVPCSHCCKEALTFQKEQRV